MAQKGKPLEKKTKQNNTSQNNAIRTNYAKKIRRNKIASVGYVVIETKQSIM